MSATTHSFQAPETLLPGLRRFGAAAAGFGLLLSAAGLAMSGIDRFYQAYLVAYVFWTGIAVGCLALLMVQHLSGGAWGIVIRRPLEAAAKTIPLMGVLFLPIAAGLPRVYEWARPDAASDPIIQAKALYLNTPFFLLRYVIYFAIWSGLAMLLSRWSAEQDRTGDPALARKMARVSGAGLVIYALTVTFAMVDWTMSVNPHWFSTIWGMLHMAGQGLSAFAFMITVLILLAGSPPLDTVITSHHLHDLGKLLFAFLMLWAYLTFSQFLITWAANLPEEIPHYLTRWDQGWQYVSLFIIVLHFAVPYALLLSRDIKRHFGKLRAVAVWILFARVVDYYWHVAPEFQHGGLSPSLLDVALPLALGGIFITLFVSHLGGRSLLPVGDPDLDKALALHVH
jgi:hypothetical protein